MRALIVIVRRIEWGHLGLVFFLAGAVLWYVLDAWRASSRLANMIFIAPAGVLCLLFCAYLLFRVVAEAVPAPEGGAADEAAEQLAAPTSVDTNVNVFIERFRSPILVILLGLYVLALDTIGFDLATFLFMAAVLRLQDERRGVLLFGYSALFALLLTWSFKAILPFPMTTLLF